MTSKKHECEYDYDPMKGKCDICYEVGEAVAEATKDRDDAKYAIDLPIRIMGYQKYIAELEAKNTRLLEALKKLLTAGHETLDMLQCRGDFKEVLDHMEAETEAEQAIAEVRGE